MHSHDVLTLRWTLPSHMLCRRTQPRQWRSARPCRLVRLAFDARLSGCLLRLGSAVQAKSPDQPFQLHRERSNDGQLRLEQYLR